jgi:hypothetical protein
MVVALNGSIVSSAGAIRTIISHENEAIIVSIRLNRVVNITGIHGCGRK